MRTTETNRRRLLAIIAAAGLLAAAMSTTGCFAFRREPVDWNDNVDIHIGDGSGSTSSSQAGGPVFPVGDATKLDALLQMGAGKLTVSSAETGTIEAGFRYSGDQFKPRSSYDVDSEGLGRLVVRQRDPQEFDWSDLDRGGDYAWDIGLPPGLPTEFHLEMGAGESDIDLSRVDVTRLDVALGAGDATIDLSGPRTHDVAGEIQAGVGSLKLIVPRDVGVRVEGRHDGIGDYSAEGMTADGEAYVNDAYGKSDVTLDITLQRGIGDVTIEQAD